MASDEELLLSGDPEDFGRFYDRYVDLLLGHFAKRVRDPEAAAELTAETFAAALVARRRFRRAATSAAAWLFGIAEQALADFRRVGTAPDRMRRHLELAQLPVAAADADRIVALGRDAPWHLMDELPSDRPDAVRVRVLEE
jgi:DNA-directed RNA polymerase specialized sigma24 family protein